MILITVQLSGISNNCVVPAANSLRPSSPDANDGVSSAAVSPRLDVKNDITAEALSLAAM